MTQPSRIDGLPDLPKPTPVRLPLPNWSWQPKECDLIREYGDKHWLAGYHAARAESELDRATFEAGSAAAAQAAKQVPAGWQPIETAPRDGTHILACNAARPYDDHTTFNQNPPHVVHWFNDGLYLSATGLNEQMKPYEYTHWKPLGAEPCDTKRIEAEAARYPQTEAQLVCDHCGADRLKQPCGEPHRPDGCRFTGKAQAAAPSATSVAEAAKDHHICLDTRLIEHEIKYNYAETAVAAHDVIEGNIPFPRKKKPE